MRKWKIRTKMVAGLSCLALVIGVLVYSNWSQLQRDRILADEISQLADEITYALELNRISNVLQQSHRRFADITKDRGMIDSGSLDTSEKMFEIYRMDSNLSRLRSQLETYRSLLVGDPYREQSTILLVDRSRQLATLGDIEFLLEGIVGNWDQVRGLDPAVLERQPLNEGLEESLADLAEVTATHFKSINDAMKQFNQSFDSEQKSKRRRFVGYTTAAAFLIAFLAWSFWTLIVVPFRTLFRGSELIAAGHHKHKIILGTDDEIGLMAETVNNITDRFNQAVDDVTRAKLDAEQQVRDRTREVIRNEQLASVGFLAAGVAHEINNPLGVIAWTAEALECSLEDLSDEQRAAIDDSFLDELSECLTQVQSEAFRCKGITRRLLDFSRLGDSSRGPEDIGELVERVAAMVSKVGEYRCKELITHCGDDVIAHCNSQEIQQVVLNLVSNALESVDTDGRVDVYVRTETDPHGDADQAVIIVADNGCGMTPEVLDKLFEPFFTRRRDNTGTGLGLSISSRIVSLHHGSLTAHSDGEGCGSKFILRLPSRPEEKEAAGEDESAATIRLEASLTEWDHVQKAA